MFGKKEIFVQEEEIEILPVFSMNAEEEEEMKQEEYKEILPILALKNMVLFPGVIIPVTIGRPQSLAAVNEAYQNDKFIAVLTQKSVETQNPSEEDLYGVGVVAKIVRLIKMPDGNSTAILQGRRRFQMEELLSTTPLLKAKISVLSDDPIEDQVKFEVLSTAIKDLGEKIITLSPQLPKDASMVLRNIRHSAFLINFIASNLSVNVAGKQELIELNNVVDRAELVLQHMHNEMQILELKGQIESKVKTDLDKQQRDYILNQQMRMIQEELGESPQQEEIEELKAKAEAKQWPAAVKAKFDRDFRKLQRMNSMVPEYSITLNYLELLTDLPWDDYTKDNFDLKLAEEILNKDHFGLDKVKDRILEYLAVLKLRKDMKAPILCLVGPPGVGKTSLGKSIAKALGREYIRMSLGGLHDESELRGHRKTYIGAMPGRVVQSLKKAGASNPVFILDEIDKIGNSFRGDPSSALLEILDPEQNTTFYDNYLELEYDLSKVLFIATSNALSTIQPALLDRMELIEVSGYSIEEKLEIAKQHLIPKQLKEHGLTEEHFSITPEALLGVVRDYTRESGVRSLERYVARLMRHVAKNIAQETAVSVQIEATNLERILGSKRVITDMYEEQQGAGVAIGLAWTQVGGDILFIEASLSKGKGRLTLTGNLGDVMKESASTALSYLKSHADTLGIPVERFSETDVHIHVPAGAIPKDGPSAGITMLSALASAFTNQPLNAYLAMTGEITLRGRVLRVGGIKEKILAAKRAGIKTIILCIDNKQDVDEIKESYIEGVNFQYVQYMHEVLDLALSK